MNRRPQRLSHFLADNFVGEGLMAPGADELMQIRAATCCPHAISWTFNAASRHAPWSWCGA
jgi:hypothetical protein